MDFLDGFPLVEIGWTALVFLSGYMFGRLRFRRDDDLIGPPPDLGRHSTSARPVTRAPVDEPPSLTDDLSTDGDVNAAVEAALAHGNKIEAIKIVREATGMGLKESKEIVDRWR